MAGPHALLFINMKSRRGQENARLAKATLEALGVTVTVGDCKQPKPQIEALKNSIDRIVIGGGDGTINHMLNKVLYAGLPLGILPLGTANDFARTVGIPTELRDACLAIASGNTAPIDLGLVNNRYFVNVASLGLSVELTRNLTGTAKKKWGILAYLFAGIKTILKARPFSAEIESDRKKFRVKTVQIAVGNGKYYGGGMAIRDNAAINDGQLDVYSLEISHWYEIIPIIFAMRFGKQAIFANVRTFRSKSLTIRTRHPKSINSDGEIVESTPATFQVLPERARVFVPQNSTIAPE